MSLRLRSSQLSDLLLLGRVMRRLDRASASAGVEATDEVSPLDLVWYEADLCQETLLLATLAQKLKLLDGTEPALRVRIIGVITLVSDECIVCCRIHFDAPAPADAQPLREQQFLDLRRPAARGRRRLLPPWGHGESQLRAKLRCHVRFLSSHYLFVIRKMDLTLSYF